MKIDEKNANPALIGCSDSRDASAELSKMNTAAKTYLYQKIHNGVAQSLSIACMRLEFLASWAKLDQEKAKKEILCSVSELKHAIKELREIIAILRS